MNKKIVVSEDTLIKSSFPKWFKIFGSICFAITLLLFAFYTFSIIYSNQISTSKIILLVLISLSLWFFIKLLFYSVTATEGHLKNTNPLGTSKKFTWKEIIEVQRPRFGIPYDFTYVVSNNNDKLLLIRSMKNYNELIEFMKVKAPNLQKCKS